MRLPDASDWTPSIAAFTLLSWYARHVEHSGKQRDGSRRMTEANGEDSLLLSSIGRVLPLDDAYNKVTLEPPIHLVWTARADRPPP